jgi:hypothetical protein
MAYYRSSYATEGSRVSRSGAQASGAAAAGGCLATIALLVAAALFGALFYVQQTQHIILTTPRQIVEVVAVVCVAAVVALLCAALASALNLYALTRSANARRVFALLYALVVLGVMLVFTLTTLAPRVLALAQLNSQVVPFAYAMRDDCQKPLERTSSDLSKTASDDQANVNNDQGFATMMSADANLLQQDAAALASSSQMLQGITAPEPKYQHLLSDCQATVSGLKSFLTDENGPHAIHIPAPYDSIFAPTMSGITLLKTVAAIAGGTSQVQAPASALQPVLAAAIPPILALVPVNLTSEGTQLQQDIRTTLDTSLAPFQERIPLE